MNPSRWAWAGVVFQDIEGNFVAWQVTRPDGQIQHRLHPPPERLQLDLVGQMRRWTGQWPVREQQAIAQYPPPPLELE